MFRLPLGLTALALAVSAPAAAQDDAGFEIELRGRLLLDIAKIDEDFTGLNDDYSDSQVRTARIGVEGGWRDWSYVAEADFAGDSVSLNDVSVSWSRDGFTFRAGHFRPPNSIEAISSGRFTTFLERAQATDAFRYVRRVGATVARAGENYTLTGGVFGGTVGDDSTGFHISDAMVVAGRATFLPVQSEDRIVHLGVHARYYDEGDDGSESLRQRARPGVRMADRYVVANPAGETATLLGVEAAWIEGPFHALVEAAVEDPEGGEAVNTAALTAGWFITGEQRAYRASTGEFRRTAPARPVTEGGMGAWELAFRADRFDAGSDGTQTAIGLALNWYPVETVRVMVNAIHAEADGAGARFGEGEMNAIQARFQVDW
jgi:phosphate-selective porin OprO/OprP